MTFRVLLALVALPAFTLSAQSPGSLRLSLAEAMARADSASETVGIARAGVTRAEADRQRARSGLLPQLNGSATYSRTIKSQFAAFANPSDTFPSPVNCGHYTPNPGLPLGARLDSLERGLDCTANSGGIDFASLPFGRANTYNFGLAASQSLFNAPLHSQVKAAAAAGDAAAAGLVAERTRAVLDVAKAYLDAQLAERLLEIADSTMSQAGRAYEQTRLEKNVGNAAEFDLLRATVSRDNQKPIVIQRRAARDRTLQQLRQLLDLPAGTALSLTTPLGDTLPAALPTAVMTGASDTAIAGRVPVRQAEAGLRASEARAQAANGSKLPSLSLSSTYAKIAFPARVFGINKFLTDWSVVLRMDVPLFTGGRIHAEKMGADADRDAAALRFRQARETAERETADVVRDLDAANATWIASSGTAELAVRAYAIADVRYRNGLSTLTELSESRLQLEQAQANRAQAVRDLRVASIRASLLRDLPFGTGQTGPGGY